MVPLALMALFVAAPAAKRKTASRRRMDSALAQYDHAADLSSVIAEKSSLVHTDAVDQLSAVAVAAGPEKGQFAAEVNHILDSVNAWAQHALLFPASFYDLCIM